jgi:hypothetical protein
VAPRQESEVMSEVKVRLSADYAAGDSGIDLMTDIYSITTELEMAGHGMVAEGLETLAEAIDGFAPRAMKSTWLNGIRLLSEQASLPAARRDRDAVSTTLNDLRAALPQSPRLAKAWQTSGPWIVRFFH